MSYKSFSARLSSIISAFIESLFEIRTKVPVYAMYRKPASYGRPVLEILFQRKRH